MGGDERHVWHGICLCGAVFYLMHWKKRNEHQMMEVSPSGVGMVLRLERDAWSMVK